MDVLNFDPTDTTGFININANPFEEVRTCENETLDSRYVRYML